MAFDYDVCVLGAGPAGSATARWLALDGCRVALIERSRFERPRIGESMAPSVQPLLMELGVWPLIQASRPLPSYGTRSVWGGDQPESHSHLATPWGCGWHVDRVAFDRTLAEAAAAGGATWLPGTEFGGAEPSGTGWSLRFVRRDADDERATKLELSARVVIDATGRNAQLARWVGARRQQLDHLVAVAVEVGGIDTTSEGYVMVEAAADGWWYTAPVPGDRMMAMLMTDGDLWRRAASASMPVWAGRLATAHYTHKRVAPGRPSDQLRIVSAMSQRLERAGDPAPWLAVGDAAVAVDPISGSGVVRALRTARSAASATLACLELGDLQAIHAYEVERDREWQSYVYERSMYYALERRWSGSSFWRRRHVASK
jgi:flavin-dependent dehydrogenase